MAIDNISLYIPPEKRNARENVNKFLINNIDTTVNQYEYLLIPNGLSNFYGYKFKLNGLNIHLEATSRGGLDNSKLIHIRWQPSDFDTFEHSEQIIAILDNPINPTLCSLPSDNGISENADLNRIDYHMILEADVLDVISGLYISTRSILTGLQDIVDPEESHLEQEYEAGNFRSFRIGKNDKYIRIYDYNRSRGINAPDTPPRTKVELSLNSKSAIKKLMRSSLRQRDNLYQGKWSELREHLLDIANGHTNPFKGIILNKIKFNDPSIFFTDNTANNWDEIENYFSLKRDFQLGLGLNVFRRLNRNRNFVRTHHRYFTIKPYIRSQQLTHLYRRSMQSFLRPISNPQTAQELVLNRCLCIPQPIRRWRTELTE